MTTDGIRSLVTEALRPWLKQPHNYEVTCFEHVIDGRKFSFGLRFECEGRQQTEYLTVDVDKKRVVWSGREWFLGYERRTAAAAFQAWLTVPVALVCLPYILVAVSRYRWNEERESMSRHASALMRALDGQLSDEENDLLMEVFRNEYALAREVDLVEARNLLRQANLVVSDMSRENGRHAVSIWVWKDMHGDVIADAEVWSEETAELCVRVLGSRFRGGKAAILLDSYATKVSTDPDA